MAGTKYHTSSVQLEGEDVYGDYQVLTDSVYTEFLVHWNNYFLDPYLPDTDLFVHAQITAYQAGKQATAQEHNSAP